MEQPIARAPHFRSFSPNIPPQTAKNIALELGIHGLAFGGKFMVHNPSNVEKHDEELVSKLFNTPTYIYNLKFLDYVQVFTDIRR
jgi:hypothetical protein